MRAGAANMTIPVTNGGTGTVPPMYWWYSACSTISHGMQTHSTNNHSSQIFFVFAEQMYWWDWLTAPVIMVRYKGDCHVSMIFVSAKQKPIFHEDTVTDVGYLKICDNFKSAKMCFCEKPKGRQIFLGQKNDVLFVIFLDSFRFNWLRILC
jgi:hypothetical protein